MEQTNIITTMVYEERDRVAEFVRLWGGPASNAVLDPAFEIYTLPTIEGIIGYRVAHNYAVTFGDPICSPNNAPELSTAFHHFCEDKGWNIIYLTASQKFSDWALKNVCQARIEVGDESYLDPHSYPTSGSNGRLLRKKMKHCEGEGVTVSEYLEPDEKVEKAIEQAGKAWLKGRSGPQIYMSHVHLFADRDGKRWFYAQQNDQIVGVLLLNQLESKQGWLLNLLMPTPEAPNGTSELLVISMLNILSSENCHYLSFGITPAEKLEDIQGLNDVSKWVARNAFKAVDKIFHLHGRRKFWEKFEPLNDHCFVLLSDSTIRLRMILSILRVLNVGL